MTNPPGLTPLPVDAAAVAKRDSVLETVFKTREAVPTGEMVTLTPEQAKARRRRSMWMALALAAFVILIFTLTLTKMGANVMVRDL
jgi:hypothetical protein